MHLVAVGYPICQVFKQALAAHVLYELGPGAWEPLLGRDYTFSRALSTQDVYLQG